MNPLLESIQRHTATHCNTLQHTATHCNIHLLLESIQLCLRVLVRCWGRLGRVKFILDVLTCEKKTSRPITPIQPLPGDSVTLDAISTGATRGGDKIYSRGGEVQPRGPVPLQERNPKRSRERFLRSDLPAPQAHSFSHF